MKVRVEQQCICGHRFLQGFGLAGDRFCKCPEHGFTYLNPMEFNHLENWINLYKLKFDPILLEGEEIIMSTPTGAETVASRGPIYGEAVINLACTQELCDVFDKYIERNGNLLAENVDKDYVDSVHDAHKAAMHLVLTKIARIATGAFHEDNYIDIEGYAIIARKIMKGESTLPEGK